LGGQMSRSNEYYRAKMRSEQALLAQQRECDNYPNFNGWVKALEKDPEFIEKTEKRLDDELGKDRLI